MRIGVLCSGGDAPGMNACVRAVVRSAVSDGHEVVGIRHGYRGLLEEDLLCEEDSAYLSARSVSHILQCGGTILHSSRCAEFATPAGREQAAATLRRHKIDALIPIGGDGTFRGAKALADVWHGKIIGCPGTIDNDLVGTDYTIGFQTAVGTAVECIDKLRDTAESHERMFLVEVMGRNSGYLALNTALAAGAEIVCVPEVHVDAVTISKHVVQLKQLGKKSIIIVVAEGDEEGGAIALNEKLQRANCPFPTRTVILAHVQRGGSPSPADRILATRLGDFAVQSLTKGANGVMAGEIGGKCVLTKFADTYQNHKPLPDHQVELIQRMSC